MLYPGFPVGDDLTESGLMIARILKFEDHVGVSENRGP